MPGKLFRRSTICMLIISLFGDQKQVKIGPEVYCPAQKSDRECICHQFRFSHSILRVLSHLPASNIVTCSQCNPISHGKSPAHIAYSKPQAHQSSSYIKSCQSMAIWPRHATQLLGPALTLANLVKRKRFWWRKGPRTLLSTSPHSPSQLSLSLSQGSPSRACVTGGGGGLIGGVSLLLSLRFSRGAVWFLFLFRMRGK